MLKSSEAKGFRDDEEAGIQEEKRNAVELISTITDEKAIAIYKKLS